jgi:hypothetical protein
MLLLASTWNDLWLLYHKCTFDGYNRLIIVAPGVTQIDVKKDVYSDWKEWGQLWDNAKYPAALRTVGGDPTIGEQSLGATFFLINGWRMKTWEGDHILNVVGNLYVEGGGEPFVSTHGYTIQVNMAVSNLTEIIDQSAEDAVISRKILTNRQVEAEDGTVVTIYDDDSLTPLGTWTWSEENKTRGKLS